MNFLETFWNYLLVSSPYLMLGCFVSGLLHVYLPWKTIQNSLGGKSVKNILKASLIGVPLPLCSCSVIPTAVTLKKKGASNSATSAFLISTPESGVDSIFMTYGLMDPFMTILRPIVAFASAFFAGILQYFFNETEAAKAVDLPEESCCPSKKEKSSKLKQVFSFGFFKLIEDISFWLIVGLIVGACIQYFFPEDFFQGIDPGLSKLAILIIGVPLYICASATTPIAVSLVLKGMSPGSALLLLMVGPATNISNIFVLKDYIGYKGIILNIVAVVVTALAAAFAVDYVYANFLDIKWIVEPHDHEGPIFHYIRVLSSIALIILLIRGLYFDKFKHKSHS